MKYEFVSTQKKENGRASSLNNPTTETDFTVSLKLAYVNDIRTKIIKVVAS